MISFWKQARPAPPCLGEDFVEHDFAVVDFARVDVQEEGAGGGEDAVGFDHARAEEADVVVEDVGVDGRGGELFGAVAIAAEAGAVALRIANRPDAGALLRDAGVEGRVDVDELDAGVGERAQGGEVVVLKDAEGGAGQGVAPETSLNAFAFEDEDRVASDACACACGRIVEGVEFGS